MASEEQIAKAVDAATELFWRNGFDETSIEDVVAATGMNRYALYTSFGGKREMFLAALDAYCNQRKQIFMDAFNRETDAPLAAVRAVAEYCIEQNVQRGTGCLLCDIGAEVGRQDSIVAEQIELYLAMIKEAHAKAFRKARKLGHLNPAITPNEAAALIQTFILGAGAQAKRGASKQELLSLHRSLMALISAGSDG